MEVRQGGTERIHIHVVSGNRLIALGLCTLAERCGLTPLNSSLAEAADSSSDAELTLLHCGRLDAEAREAMACLRDARVRFIAVVEGLDGRHREEVYASGAVQAFDDREGEHLALVLSNFRETARPSARRFTLDNGFVVDLDHWRVHRGPRYLQLSVMERQILAVLHQEARVECGRPVEVQRMTARIWGAPDARSPITIRGYVSQLRGKVEVDADRPKVLLGARGRGYWLKLRQGA